MDLQHSCYNLFSGAFMLDFIRIPCHMSLFSTFHFIPAKIYKIFMSLLNAQIRSYNVAQCILHGLKKCISWF